MDGLLVLCWYRPSDTDRAVAKGSVVTKIDQLID